MAIDNCESNNQLGFNPFFELVVNVHPRALSFVEDFEGANGSAFSGEDYVGVVPLGLCVEESG